MDEQEMFSCECHSECIVAARFEDEKWVELAFWATGQGAPGLLWKLGRIWRFLRKGGLYEDYVMLSPKNARRLARFLLRGDAGRFRLTGGQVSTTATPHTITWSNTDTAGG